MATKRASAAAARPTGRPRAAREIPVTIKAGNIGTDEALHDYIAGRISMRLAKFRGALQRVSVRLDDLNGPKNAPGHRCAVKVSIARHESVMVEVVDAAPRIAFDRAMDSAERAVKRSLEKVRSKARRGATAKG